MISFKDLYSVLSAVVPLYVTMFLAYASVKWWNVFSPDQCAGINRFVAIFAVPLLSFEVISRINPYKMDFLFIAADGVSKILILLILFFWAKFCKRGSLDWAITIFSISTLPNTLVMGIPLLKSMYGDDKEYLMIQAVVLQCIVWYTLLLFLFEYREARTFILSKFRDASVSNNSTTEIRSSGCESFGGTQEMLVVGGGGGGGEDGVVRTLSSAQTTPNVNKVAPDSRSCPKPTPAGGVVPATEEDGKEVHLFIWGCGCCSSQGGVCGQSVQVCRSREEEMKIEGKRGEEEKPNFLRDQNMAASSTNTSSTMLKQILKRVWFKLVRNPNSYASVLGLTWALTSCRWGIKMPQIMENSVTILSDAGLGMAMFSLGLFMALQPRIIACGNRLAAYGMIVRFLAGPAVMAVASVAVGLRGNVLRVAIVQAALPQGIVPFVFSREYNLHPEMLSTAVIFGMIVSLPITILYYVLLGL